MTPEVALRSILRLFGTFSLTALVFVVAPQSWMDAIHSELGLGPLPRDPIVGYLARSTSAFYALVGGLFWTISFDIAGNRRVLTYLGVAVAFLGVALLGIDWWEGLPLLWKLWEGPFVVALGLTVLLLSRRIGSADRTDR